MAEILLRAIQGEAVTFTVTLSTSTFQGTEPLTATIGVGDSQAALLTVTPSWTNGQTTGSFGKVDIALTAAQTLALVVGSYTVTISIADGSASLSRGELTIYPGVGGADSSFRRLLCSPAYARELLPVMPQEQIDALPDILTAATETIESYCARPLVIDSYDHIIRPNNTIRLRLRARPIVEVSRVSADVIPGCKVTYSGSAQTATLQEVNSGPKSLAIKSIVLTSTTNGVASSQTILLAGYPTFSLLAGAINALSNGWSATVANSALGDMPTSDAFGVPGARGAKNQNLWIHTHSMQLGQWWVDADHGWLEMNEPIPGGYLISNPRVERTDTRYWGIRVTYRAGYAYLKSDLDLGYRPVPADLAACCVGLAKALLEGLPLAGPVKTQTVRDRSYSLQKDPSMIPAQIRSGLAKYIEAVF